MYYMQFVKEYSSFSFDHFYCSACEPNYLDGDPMSRMEKGYATPKNSETPAHALVEGLKKQRRGSQGFPENAIVDSDDGDVVEQEDYLRQKMKKQRRMSQGYADGYKSADDEPTAVGSKLKRTSARRESKFVNVLLDLTGFVSQCFTLFIHYLKHYFLFDKKKKNS